MVWYQGMYGSIWVHRYVHTHLPCVVEHKNVMGVASSGKRKADNGKDKQQKAGSECNITTIGDRARL